MPNDTAIDIRNLSHTYPDGTHAIEDLSLSIERGERVALLGPNGAGKSTLILHLNGVLMPTAGEVRIGDELLAEEGLRTIRQRVGLVFQDPDDQLFMATVHDDVAFGPLNMGLSDEEADARTHEALHAVGLADTASKSGQNLSFGQRKRVALATILSMRPETLVLDEPTSNLDPRSRRQMIELLDGIESTMVLATHDMDLAWTLCRRCIVVDGGTVVADGARDEILGDADLLEQHGLELPPSLAGT